MNKPHANTIPVLLAVAIGATLPLAGCSDAGATDEAAFRKALEPIVRDAFCEDLGATPMEIEGSDPTEAWPLTITAKPPKYAGSADVQARRMLAAAVAAGSLTAERRTLPVRLAHSGGAFSAADVSTYTPTGRGKDTFRTIVVPKLAGSRPLPGRCPAAGAVVAVVRWTEPADMAGQTMTRVTYTYHGVDIDPTVRAAKRAEIERPKEAIATLVRTNDGWRSAGG